MRMNKMLKVWISLFLLTAGSLSVLAQESGSGKEEMSRPITGLYALETGRRNVLATYLSPLHYTGKSLGVYGAWSKAMPFSPQHAIMHFDTEFSLSSLLNPQKTAGMIGMSGSFNWGMSWRTHLPYQVQVTAGGAIGIEGGAYYLLRNGNNPVEAIADVALSIRASVSKPFKIGRLPILLRDEISLPSLGVFFSPQYGETYYEIYLGNHKDLFHAGWWGNNFRIDNLLSATLDFGRTAMTVGYRFNAYTQWASHLNTKIFTHSFVIGVIPGGIGMKKKKVSVPSERVYSIY